MNNKRFITLVLFGLASVAPVVNASQAANTNQSAPTPEAPKVDLLALRDAKNKAQADFDTLNTADKKDAKKIEEAKKDLEAKTNAFNDAYGKAGFMDKAKASAIAASATAFFVSAKDAVVAHPYLTGVAVAGTAAVAAATVYANNKSKEAKAIEASSKAQIAQANAQVHAAQQGIAALKQNADKQSADYAKAIAALKSEIKQLKETPCVAPVVVAPAKPAVVVPAVSTKTPRVSTSKSKGRQTAVRVRVRSCDKNKKNNSSKSCSVKKTK